MDESDDDIGMEASDLLRHATQTWTLRSRIKLTQLEADLAALKTRVEVLQGVLRLVARR